MSNKIVISDTTENCFELFFEKAVIFPNNAFLHIPFQACRQYSNESIDISYFEALLEIEKIKEYYKSKNYTPGKRIALMLDNRSEFFLHFLALNSLGICVVPISSQFSRDEILYLIEHSEVCLVISLAIYSDVISKACKNMTSTVPLVSVDELDSLPFQDSESFDEPFKINLDTEAAILYTSGTTGKPKGCLLSNRYFISWGNWYVGLGEMATLTTGQERLITPLPVHHQNAMACSFMGMLASAGCIIQLDGFHSSTWWDTVRSSKATIIHYLGVMPAMLLNLPEKQEEKFNGQIKFGLGAGADPKHHARFEARFGFPLLEGWAMTETGGTACLMSKMEPRNVGQRCLGKAPEYFEYKLVNEIGEECLAGEAGELLVRTKTDRPRLNFFSGYFKNPEATEEAWEGGYFHTGDVMRVDLEGYFYFVDRRKNVIRRSGENISAIEVEAILLQHTLISACAVTSVNDEFRGEEVLALIVLNNNVFQNQPTAEEILSFALKGLVYYKTPGHIIFVDQLPIGSTQKVKRGEIKELADKWLNTSRHFDLTKLKKRPTVDVEN